MNMRQKLFHTLLAFFALGLATPALAQSRGTPPAYYQATRLGPLIGMEFADGDTGLAIRGDLQMPISRIAPNVNLDFVLSPGLSWWSYGSARYGDNVDVTLFKLVPALRFTVPLTPTIGIYGDAGIGFYFDNVDFGRYAGSDTGFGATMRFAGGVFADVAPNVRLGGELGVNPYFGDYDNTNVTLLFSAMFRL